MGNNYDNFKMVEKLLSKRTNIPKTSKIPKFIELGNKENNIVNTDEKEKENPDYNYEPPAEPFIINDEPRDINEKDKEESFKGKNLGLIKAKHFLYYNSKLNYCVKNEKKSKIIESCYEICSKYLSIDLILQNQIMLENLFKDYKWNNPELKKIESNEFIIKLNNI